MQNETASSAFLKYGHTYKELTPEENASLISQTSFFSSQRTVSQLFCYDCDVRCEVQGGLGILLVSRKPYRESIEEFGINRKVLIKANTYFSFIATTPELAIRIYTPPDYSMDAVPLSDPYTFHPILPRIQISDIIGYYYRVRTTDYRFKGERHQFYELTYVDTGTLYTEVNGTVYKLGEKEMIIYGPGQFHTQYTDSERSVSYVTILFNMSNLTPAIGNDWNSALLNKVFPYTKKTYTLMKTIVQESIAGSPYMDSLMLCLLTETIIRLLQDEHLQKTNRPSSVTRQNYQDELFEQIVTYIESRIHEPLTVSEICQKFSLSRSSLQVLFKSAINQSPKRFISDMKLEKSCQMLRENRYTISEISLRLGYSSIHYFSNAFSQKYHISPSEYAKRIM